jgi:putative ABC transport system permease protein
VESLALSAIGAAAGAALAALSLRPLLSLQRGSSALLDSARLDGGVLAFTAVVAVVTGLLCAALPVLLAARTAPAGVLAETTAKASGGLVDRRLRRVLMAAQVGLAVVLLAGAASMLRSVHALARSDLGFDPSRTLSLRVTLPTTRYASSGERVRFAERVLERVRAVPGVQSAGLTTNRFVRDGSLQTTVAFEGRPSADGEDVSVHFRRIAGDYFGTVRVPVLRGRAFGEQDRDGALPVTIVSRSMAAAYWPDADPLGRRLKRTGDHNPWLTVVGVVGDVMDAGAGVDLGSTLYLPFAQNAGPWVNVVARTTGDPALLERALRAAVRSVDPLLAFDEVAPLERLVSESLSEQRFRALLLGLFAALGLVLATVGVYGVTSFLVAERTREMGVRIALGARSADVVRLVLADSARDVGAGIAVGVAATFVLAVGLEGLARDLARIDVATVAGVSALLAGVAFAATVAPAVRAGRVPPMRALRGE